jgi:general secretion pathway protein I
MTDGRASQPRPRTGERGFTLLEVMISLGILAVALVAISDLNGGAVAMHAYSRRATEATLLLRGKMLDLEEDLQKNGFSDFNDDKRGDFADENAAGYSWNAEILKPDVRLDPAQLIALLGGQTGGAGTGGAASGKPDIGAAASALAGMLGGGGGSSGPQPVSSGSPLSGPLGGLMTTQATAFIETLKKSVREIRVTVAWAEGKRSQSVSASQMIVILPEQVGQTQGAPQAVQPGIPGQTPITPGNPALPPVPGVRQ